MSGIESALQRSIRDRGAQIEPRKLNDFSEGRF